MEKSSDTSNGGKLQDLDSIKIMENTSGYTTSGSTKNRGKIRKYLRNSLKMLTLGLRKPNMYISNVANTMTGCLSFIASKIGRK